MRKLQRPIIISIMVGTLISGCELVEKGEKLIMPILSKIERTVTEEKNVKIKCKKDNIAELEKAGWKIIDKTEKEVVCSWKTKRSRPGCDLDNDKGCKITVPDKEGKEIEYTLQKKTKLNR